MRYASAVTVAAHAPPFAPGEQLNVYDMEGFVMGEKSLKVTSGTWDGEVMQAQGLVLVDFWAVWCGPCQMVGPVVEELAGEYEGKLKVCKLNTDENPDIASKYRIMGIPTLMFFKNGAAVDQVVGAVPKAQLKSKIDSLL